MEHWQRKIKKFRWNANLSSTRCIKDTKICDVSFNNKLKHKTVIYGLRTNTEALVTKWSCRCDPYNYKHLFLNNDELLMGKSDSIHCEQLPIKLGKQLVCYMSNYILKFGKIFQKFSNMRKVSYEMAVHLMNETRKNVNIGPGHWRQIVIALHTTEIKNEIARNNPQNLESLFQANEYKKIAQSFVLKEHYFKKLFVFIYWKIIRPHREDWRIWISRMGGQIISCDMTYSVSDKIYGIQDCRNLPHSKNSDGRSESLQILAGTLTLQNWAHFSFDEILIPRASEKHCYVAPEIGIFIGYLCENSEQPITKLNIKHDGFESGLNLDVKCGYCTKAIFGSKIRNKHSKKIINVDDLIHNISVKNMYTNLFS